MDYLISISDPEILVLVISKESRIRSTALSDRIPSFNIISRIGTPVSSASFATFVAVLYPTWGFKAVITPILFATYALHTSIRSEEHTSELQSRFDLVCRLLLEI